MSTNSDFIHTATCAVHSPTLRPCSCGLETRMRDSLTTATEVLRELIDDSLMLNAIEATKAGLRYVTVAMPVEWITRAFALVDRPSEQRPADLDSAWLIWSNEHHMWWGHDRCGYRKNPDDAGRYTFDAAMSICRVRSWESGIPPETMVHESAVWFGAQRPGLSSAPVKAVPNVPSDEQQISVVTPSDERPFVASLTPEARNAYVQSRYDELMAEGKHGHYETLFRVVAEVVAMTHSSTGAVG